MCGDHISSSRAYDTAGQAPLHARSVGSLILPTPLCSETPTTPTPRSENWGAGPRHVCGGWWAGLSPDGLGSALLTPFRGLHRVTISSPNEAWTWEQWPHRRAARRPRDTGPGEGVVRVRIPHTSGRGPQLSATVRPVRPVRRGAADVSSHPRERQVWGPQKFSAWGLHLLQRPPVQCSHRPPPPALSLQIPLPFRA